MFWFEQYRTQTWHFILAKGIPTHDAEEVFQEVRLACWQTCANHQNPPALLFRIARNKIADYWRKRAGRTESQAALPKPGCLRLLTAPLGIDDTINAQSPLRGKRPGFNDQG